VQFAASDCQSGGIEMSPEEEIKVLHERLHWCRELNAELLWVLRLLAHSYPAHCIGEPNASAAMQAAKAIIAKAEKLK
jgi:hypothetical protein